MYTRNHHERNICFFLNILAQCSESAQIYKDLEADNCYFSRKLVDFGKIHYFWKFWISVQILCTGNRLYNNVCIKYSYFE